MARRSLLWCFAAPACALAGALSCAPRALVLAPLGPASNTCPAGGCGAAEASRPPSPATDLGCPEASCGGGSPEECTDRALASWSDARDERALSCIARMLTETCALEEPRACGFAGRLWLDGRGVPQDVTRGLELLARSCDDGFATACAAGAKWAGDTPDGGDAPGVQELLARLEAERTCLAGQSESCFQVASLFYAGHEGYPTDHPRAARAFGRGCDLGDSRACNSFGELLASADGVPGDSERAVEALAKACRLGEGLGCSNLGYRVERGDGIQRDTVRARALYRQGCAGGDMYGCFHAELLAATEAGPVREPARAFARWRASCDRRDARACAFVGILYLDGTGTGHDEDRSLEAMAKACGLGEGRACQWVKVRTDD